MASSSSSWNPEKSTLSEKGTLKTVPFLNDEDKRNYEDTAGDKTTRDGGGNLMENLDDLTEEELNELLQEAWDINQRLKSFERKFSSQTRGDQSLASKITLQEYESGVGSVAKQNNFLPPLEQTKTSLVAVATGTKSNAAGRQKKTSVM